MDLSGQVALVTGGSKGLGQAFAAALAQAGASVAITARSEAQLSETARAIEMQNGKVLACPADVTDPQAVARIVQEVERTLGPITLLVNSAGVFQAFGPVAEIDPLIWWREIEVNLKGPFLLARAVLPGMIANGGGRIINVASSAGIYALETISAYSASKAALIRLSEIQALEAAPHHIGVFAIDPGTVRTPMNDQVMSSESVKKNAPGVYQWFQDFFEQGLDTPIEQSVQLVMRIAAGQADELSGCFLRVTDDLDNLILRAAEVRERGLQRLRLNVG